MKKTDRAKDAAEFRAYLRACTNAQVQGVYQKERAAARAFYVRLAREEAERRGIRLARNLIV